jgi:hypothetical protein
MPVTAFNEPERLQSQQRIRLLHIELGDVELAIARRHLLPPDTVAVEDLRRSYEQAAHHLFAAYGCFAEAGLGTMAKSVMRWREEVLRICRRCVG